MEQYFAPYIAGHPATVEINGHRLVILSTSREGLEEHLDLVGGDDVQEITADPNFDTEDDAFREIALEAQASVVIPPPELDLSQVIEGLRSNLPWWQ